MNKIIIVICAFIICLGLGFSGYQSVAIALSGMFVLDLFLASNEKIAFKELLLVLFSVNYLFSPAMSYNAGETDYVYKMKIPEEQYFDLAIPSMLILWAVVSLISNKIFKPNFVQFKLDVAKNKELIVRMLLFGIVLNLSSRFMPGELGFIVYLVSMLRFIAGFSLYFYDRKKYKWHLVFLLVFEFSNSLSQGMFHDPVIWFLLFGLVWTYVNKPQLMTKLLLGVLLFFSYVILQNTKAVYRGQMASKGAGFSTFFESVQGTVGEEGGVLSEDNTTSAINRVNQAWIFASTVNNMDKNHDFQGMSLAIKYLEAAILPRVLAPNKLQAGDKNIFNKYSGHYISKGTSMGLGIFADGYIAYGYFGSLLFSLLFALQFLGVVKVVEYWSKQKTIITVLFIFPIAFYALRPDCETQTLITHIVKSIIIFAFLMYVYKPKKAYFQSRKAVPVEAV